MRARMHSGERNTKPGRAREGTVAKKRGGAKERREMDMSKIVCGGGEDICCVRALAGQSFCRSRVFITGSSLPLVSRFITLGGVKCGDRSTNHGRDIWGGFPHSPWL